VHAPRLPETRIVMLAPNQKPLCVKCRFFDGVGARAGGPRDKGVGGA
jgi:hypothetical protein